MAVYARISQARDGDGLGVKRQVADCRAEAERRGWTVAEEYVDDDLSAYSGKTRPAYLRMLRDLADGRRDAVIVWHMDRLHRRPIDLEQFADTCTKAGVTDVVTLHGDMNLGTGDGLLMARILSAVAANESDAKRRRGRRKMQELAEAGKPHGGGTRPFGFQADKVTHHPAEAAVIRTLAARALAGESITSLARWLEESDVRTVTGKTQRPQVLRGLLLNPRMYGMRLHRGETLTPATWEPIISGEDGEQLRILLTDPARRTNRSARRYLLSGLCRCAKCGQKMFSVPRFETRRYLCPTSTGFDGCGGIAISANPMQALIVEAVLHRLDSPALHDALAGRGDVYQGHAAEIARALQAGTDRLTELDVMWADWVIKRAGRRKAADRIHQCIATQRAELAGMTQISALDGLPGIGDELQARWSELNLTRQAAILKAVLDHVVIHPASKPGRHGLGPNRVEPVWRF